MHVSARDAKRMNPDASRLTDCPMIDEEQPSLVPHEEGCDTVPETVAFGENRKPAAQRFSRRRTSYACMTMTTPSTFGSSSPWETSS